MRKAPTFRSSPEPFPHAPHGCRQQNLRCPDFCPYYYPCNKVATANVRTRVAAWLRALPVRPGHDLCGGNRVVSCYQCEKRQLNRICCIGGERRLALRTCSMVATRTANLSRCVLRCRGSRWASSTLIPSAQTAIPLTCVTARSHAGNHTGSWQSHPASARQPIIAEN